MSTNNNLKIDLSTTLDSELMNKNGTNELSVFCLYKLTSFDDQRINI